MVDIAVVGISLRFPGNATSPESLWEVLEKGESQWSEFPKDRLNIDGYYHPSGDRQGSVRLNQRPHVKLSNQHLRYPFGELTFSRATLPSSTHRYITFHKY
jgi:hypothetical protein